MVLTVSIILGIPLAAATLLLILTVTPVFLIPFIGLIGLQKWVENAFNPVGDGWRVTVGRLETVRVASLEGSAWDGPRRVVALDFDRRIGPVGLRARLYAVLENGEHLKIMAGGTRATIRFARWLADRADLPVRHSDRDDVASGLVRR
jgi:hypothetical protein